MDASSLEIVKTFVPLAVPAVTAAVNNLIVPKIQKVLRAEGTERALLTERMSTKFAQQLAYSYEHHKYMNSVVFSHHERKPLYDLYVPLTLINEYPSELTFDDFVEDFLPPGEKVLVIDDAGMGKSTLLKFLFLRSVDMLVQQEEGTRSMPILIELRTLHSGKKILDTLIEMLVPIGGDFNQTPLNQDFVLKLIEAGDFTFFLDGYDEIPTDELKSITADIQDFVSKAWNNRFVMSSRPTPSLSDFPEFTRSRIRPLQKEEAYSLINKYDPRDSVASRLIREIEGKELEHVREFLENPLLVSLLFRAYDYKQIVPRRKDSFYRQVYDSLFQDHDATKSGYSRPKKSNLDIEQFHRVLRLFAFTTLPKGIAYSRDEIVRYMAKAHTECADLVFSDADLLDDLLNAVPIFALEGVSYKWKHKSIQEYFAASCICTDSAERKAPILEKLSEPGNVYQYLDVLGLCYDIDYKGFRNTLKYGLAKRFVDYCETTYKAESFQAIPSAEIKRRQGVTFARATTFIFPDNAADQYGELEESFSRVTLTPQADIPQNVLKRIIRDSPATYPILRIWSSDHALMQLLSQKGDRMMAPFAYTPSVLDWRVLAQQNKTIAALDLNDDPHSPFNAGDVFSAVTNDNSLYTISETDGKVLNFDECVQLIHDVDVERANDITKDYLADFSL